MIISSLLGTLVMWAVGAVFAAVLMVMFGAWHQVQPIVPAFGFLQVLWPLLIAETVFRYVTSGGDLGDE